jgi:hypothetical protein
MDNKPPECFTCDMRARGVRVDITPQKSIVLPHEHFICAEFMANDQIDLLKLVFVTHEIILTGHLLRRIENAILNRDLSWVCARPEKIRVQYSDRPFVLTLTVRAIEDQPTKQTKEN